MDEFAGRNRNRIKEKKAKNPCLKFGGVQETLLTFSCQVNRSRAHIHVLKLLYIY